MRANEHHTHLRPDKHGMMSPPGRCDNKQTTFNPGQDDKKGNCCAPTNNMVLVQYKSQNDDTPKKQIQVLATHLGGRLMNY